MHVSLSDQSVVLLALTSPCPKYERADQFEARYANYLCVDYSMQTSLSKGSEMVF